MGFLVDTKTGERREIPDKLEIAPKVEVIRQGANYCLWRLDGSGTTKIVRYGDGFSCTESVDPLKKYPLNPGVEIGVGSNKLRFEL